MAKKSTPAQKATATKTAAIAAEAELPTVESFEVEAEAKSKKSRSKEEIFNDSIGKVSTGNSEVDKIARKVVTAIYKKEMEMEMVEDGYSGKYNGKVPVSVIRVVRAPKKEGKAPTARYKLSVGEGANKIELGARFAAKAFRFSRAQHESDSPTVSFDEQTVAAVAALFD